VTTHQDGTTTPSAARARRAERLLSLYAQARSVVTSRLHCALPCLAFGTPVLLVTSSRDTDRFTGLDQLLHHCSPDDFLSGNVVFDADHPLENSDQHLQLREALARQANMFVSSTANTGLSAHPFAPDTDIENLIGIEQSFARKEEESRSLQRFHRQFRPGRDYSRHQPEHFLRELARAHKVAGDLEEAKRLLEIALASKPNNPGLMKDFEAVVSEMRRRQLQGPLTP